jgi:hypothetical protein
MRSRQKAERLYYVKRRFDNGALIEIVIWRVPSPVVGSGHDLKYSLFYGRDGQRLVAYDNERGKGDHRHLGDHEEPYVFIDAKKLVEDFLADVHRVFDEKDDEN